MKTASEWVRENDWDYRKYGDRRKDRSAYDSLMNYEITGLLEWAYEAGIQACIQQLGGRYGAAATKDLRMLLETTDEA